MEEFDGTGQAAWDNGEDVDEGPFSRQWGAQVPTNEDVQAIAKSYRDETGLAPE